MAVSNSSSKRFYSCLERSRLHTKFQFYIMLFVRFHLIKTVSENKFRRKYSVVVFVFWRMNIIKKKHIISQEISTALPILSKKLASTTVKFECLAFTKYNFFYIYIIILISCVMSNFISKTEKIKFLIDFLILYMFMFFFLFRPKLNIVKSVLFKNQIIHSA